MCSRFGVIIARFPTGAKKNYNPTMTDPYINILLRAKTQARKDAQEIKMLRFQLGECKALVGRYRTYFKEGLLKKIGAKEKTW